MTDIAPGLQPLQDYFSRLQGKPANASQLAEIKELVLKDHTLDRDEARFLMGKLVEGAFEAGVRQEVSDLLSGGYQAQELVPVARIGYNRLTTVKEVSAEFADLNKAKAITDENGIDEVYLKTADGRTFVAYGAAEEGGALNLKGIKPGYVGRLGNERVTVVHVNNETNTAWEGAKAPWNYTAETLSSAGKNGVVKGIGEVATTVTALFIGKTVLEKGIQTAGQKAAEAAAPAVPVTANTLLGKTKAIGSSIGGTVKGTLRSVVVGTAVAGAVVGTVVTVGSVIGAIRGAARSQDYATLDMVTGKY